MKQKLLISWFAVMSCYVYSAYSQSYENEGWESVLETLLSDEDLTSDAQEELAFMYESMHESPLNINSATREELARLPFLTTRQIEDIHAYIYMHGPMLTLGELQLTGSLDWETRQLLRHFVYAGEVKTKSKRPRLDEILRYGRNEVVAGFDVPLYLRDGFRDHSQEELTRYPNRAYLGNRLSHSIRYSFNWQNRIKAGLTADKDAGEPFLDRNRTGYDFWSPYLFVKDMGKLKELALGKFKAQFGYGLLMGGGFSTGKSMALSDAERNSQGLKPHSSTQEYGYLRGAGLALAYGHTVFTVIGAYTPLDATLKGDTLISSFKQDGYHRTELEWSRKNNVSLSTIAANIRYSYRGVRSGVTVLRESLSLPYKGHKVFSGLSLDVSVHRPRYALGAELAFLDNNPALFASQSFRLKDGWSINTVFRHYGADYLSLHSNTMADVSVQNETGILTGFMHNGRNLKLKGYLDLFIHPQPRYGASERSHGMDIRLESDWKMGRRDNLFATARFKSKQKDCKYTGQLEYCITGRYRLRWTHNTVNGTELRTQLFYTRYDFIAEPISNGWALTQSLSRSVSDGRLDINLSAALFCTDSYDSNISTYESGLRFSYNFISLYGKGARAAATVRYRFKGGNMQLSIKAGGIYYLDRDEISSAQQRIASNHKEDISVQFITKF